MDIINFVKENWIQILAIIGAIDTILGIVVSWTPVKWDNNVYNIIHNFVAKLLGKKSDTIFDK